MSQRRLRDRSAATLVAAVAATFAVAVSCRTVPAKPGPGPVPSPPPSTVPSPKPQALLPAPELELQQPTIRIGIVTDAPRVSIGAESGVVLFVRSATSGAVRQLQLPVATLQRSGSTAPASRAYRVQVASLADEPMARDTSERARAAVGTAGTLAWNESTRTFQVRVGSFETRDAAAALARRLGDAGFRGAFVVEEVRDAGGAGITLLETREELALVQAAPARRGESVTVDSMPYRGFVEVRPGDGASLTVIDALHLEDYLRGVVPNELSPNSFPQIEALKAQAIAARTYAIRNKGQFQSRGYDLCATPACQVYRGRSTEHPLTDRAVEETRGLVARYNDVPINALYTSTCGGHTEDGSNMFDGDGEPYLKGVICASERKGSGELRTTASTKAIGAEDGLNRDVALLVALDVVDAKLYSANGVKGNASDGELRDWTARLVESLRRRGCDSRVDGSLGRRSAFFEHVVDSLCWSERGRLLQPEDEGFLLRVEDAPTLRTPGERLAAAVLVQEGVLSPFSDNTLRGDEPVSRVAALRLLAGIADKSGAPGLRRAEVDAISGGELRVRKASLTSSDVYRVEPAVRLFRSLDGSRAAVSELSLIGGDKVNLVAGNDGRLLFLEAEQSRLGASADRTSKYYRWEVALTPFEVEKAIARYGSVGQVKDIEVKRTGVSGRVVEMVVRGSAGELPLRGLKIRWALGLRENLFVVDRERDAKGDVARFVFTGKGWGHGVGLCQVGAYGMAQAGAKAEQILAHYYSGVKIDRAY